MAVNVAKAEELRIGVFVCECGLNIQGTIDCAAVSEYARTLPDVVAVVQWSHPVRRRSTNRRSGSALPMPALTPTCSRW